MTIWEQYNLEERILDILDVRYSHDPEHHLGRPFLTPYQIAISFKEQYQSDFDAIGMPIGGIGTGQHTSFSQYIARELSRRINDGRFSNIEGGFLSDNNIVDLVFNDSGEELRSSSINNFDLSMFRRTD